MKINKITISNFRSIANVKDLPLDKFNVFVGQNNHGKTNFFEAIEWFFNGGGDPEIVTKEASPESVFVDIVFEGCTNGLTKIKTDSHRTKISRVIDNQDVVKIRRKFSDFKKLYYINGNGEEVDFGTGIDKALLEFFPKLQFVKTQTTLKEVSKYGRKTPISEMLSEVIEQVIENETGSDSNEYARFKKLFNELFNETGVVGKALFKIGEEVNFYVNKQFQCKKVSFVPELPTFDDLFKNITTNVDDGNNTRAEEKGDGMQRALMLAIIQTYADYRREEENSKEFIFLIDEGELHLHPTAQRNLKNALLELSFEGDQVFISTHSSVLIADENTSQKLYQVRKINHLTQIDGVTSDDKQDIVYELLGGSPSDLLFPRNFLIVEGKSEYKFLLEVIKRFYPEKRNGIQIIFAGGDVDEQQGCIHGIHKVFSPLASSNNPIYKDRAVVIFDKPNSRQEAKYNQFKTSYRYLYSNNQVFELPNESIEEYFPDPWKKTKDEVIQLQKEGLKVEYSIKVASAITQEMFESDMKVIHDALKRCWYLAFS